MMKNLIVNLLLAILLSFNYSNALRLASENDEFEIDQSKIFHRQIAMNIRLEQVNRIYLDLITQNLGFHTIYFQSERRSSMSNYRTNRTYSIYK